MADDWRLTITLPDESGHALGVMLHEHELEERVRVLLGGRVAISAGPAKVFLYAGSRTAAEEARRVVASLLEQEGKPAGFTLERWHPIEEAWEPAEVPLPLSVQERRREHERLEAQEAAETQESGYAEWEVRLDLPSHHDAVELAERLESEGFGTTRRWTFLLVGARNRDEAEALARRLEAEAPSGSHIQVQPGGEMTWEVAPRRPLVLFAVSG